MNLAVTGATGQLGGRVAERLAASGVPQRLLVRDARRAPRLLGAEVFEAEYGGSAATHVLNGISTVLMVSASETPDRVDRHRSFVDCAVRAGVQHLVYTSFAGAGPTATFTLARDHWATEEHIRSSGLGYTFLRNNLYADFFAQLVGDAGVIQGPAGAGRVATVARDDIAEVAAIVLQAPADHRDATLNLTGPQALTLEEIAQVVSVSTGRPVRFVDETVTEAYASRAHYGAPDWQVDAWVSTYTAIAAGELSEVSDDVRRVTGHAPRSLADLLSR
ncbi:MAG TPA: SDR family oxidoreductase [Propionibacteriaceae bacterium]|nr:SDR family oxidoreductase [Propionibacteriaceae bacterium]